MPVALAPGISNVTVPPRFTPRFFPRQLTMLALAAVASALAVAVALAAAPVNAPSPSPSPSTTVAAPTAKPVRLEFNRDIRPILSENCFQCHGQDPAKREAKLRLDDRASATRDRGGYAPIVPGQPDASDLILRVLSTDDEDRMPPLKANKHVTPAQIALLRRWIAEGAEYQPHWAFLPPRRAPLPAVSDAQWPRAALDRFVLARLDREKLAPAPAAPPATWLRRASFDLTGLPPTPAELDRFSADAAARGEPAYRDAADRLLASPHFGERLAIDWLDVARYADTHGFNNDSSRSMWRWRDWVIEAFNANLPYDRFITEQLAGDLLPAPTLEQRIATGFGRNHVINSEGGIIEEEYRVEYVADRVRTFSTAWLGLTTECARCHDHKFDPIAQRDYYRLFAFFNNVPEHGEDGRVANAIPQIAAPTRDQQAALAKLARELTALDAPLAAARAAWQWRPDLKPRIEALAAAAKAATANETSTVLDLAPAKIAATAAPKKSTAPAAPESSAPPVATAATPASPVASSAAPVALARSVATAAASAPPPVEPKPVSLPAAKLDFTQPGGFTLSLWLKPDADNLPDVALLSTMNYVGSPADTTYGRGRDLRLIDGELESRLCERYPAYAVIVRTEGAALRPGEWHHVALTYTLGKKAADVRLFVDGVEAATVTRYDDLPNEPAKRDYLVGTDNAPGAARFRGHLENARTYARALPADALRNAFQAQALPRAIAALDAGTAGASERAWIRDALLADEASTRDTWLKRTQTHESLLALRRALPTVMVMEELPQPRPAHVLTRGRYDAPAEPVEAGVNEALLGAWPAGAPRNRLGLARWLTQPDHPLTARVVVNRFWAQLFGTGLVKTVEDFGSQGEWPSHPELLDLLARDFVDGGWDVKALLKSLVLSSTYRQSSAVTPELVARDPENRLLARGPRVRLPAELIRDQALAISGLLTPRLGGPSVYPYQPEKLYLGIVVDAPYPSTKWGVSGDADLYRRSLYTFWKRTVPHPVMTTFDSPDREFCTVRRSRTNTPLQALTLLNEPGYVEAARRLATRMLRDAPGDDAARLAFAFQSATGRRPRAEETAVLVRTLAQLRADFAAHPDDAAALLKVGASAVDVSLAPADLAAATSVASMILNLDETITKN